MNLKFGIILSIVFSFIGLFINSYKIEKGDMNSIPMYFLVYFLPILIIAWVINYLTYIIFFGAKQKNKIILFTSISFIIIYFATNTERLEPFEFIALPLTISSLVIVILNIKKIKISE